MKNCLNEHYNNYSESIKLLADNNYWYFVILIILSLSEIPYKLLCDKDHPILRNQEVCNNLSIILYLKLLANVFLLSLLFRRSKNIKFGEWIEDLMKGYKMEHKYHECSIFIIQSPFYKDKDVYQPLIDSQISNQYNSSGSSINSFHPDYDTSNFYMSKYLDLLNNC